MRLVNIETPHLSEGEISKHALQPGRRMQDLPSDLLRLAKIFEKSAQLFFQLTVLLVNDDKGIRIDATKGPH